MSINHLRAAQQSCGRYRPHKLRVASSFRGTMTRPARSVRLICIFIAAGFTRTVPISAQLPNDSTLTRVVRERVESGRSAGIIVGLIGSDGSTRIGSWRKDENGSGPISNDAVFEIGSITKPFVGILLADMAARGELRIEDPVSAHLPAQVRVPSRSGRDITLADLATHFSGLPNSRGDFVPADPTNPYADYNRDDLFVFLSGHTLARDIGSQFEYSSLGFSLLGEALAHRSGKPFGDLLKERVLTPLGMNDTAVGSTESMRKRLVPGHDASGNLAANWTFGVFAPSGALHSTLHDMLKFVKANLHPSATPLSSAIDASHKIQRTVSPNVHVGLGWIYYSEGSDSVIYHPGETGGYHAFVGFNRAKKTGVVVLSNSRTNVDDIGFHFLMSSPLEPLAAHIASRTEVQVPISTLRKYAGEYQFGEERWRIVLENGKLFGVSSREKYQLHAESDRKFFVYEFDEQYEFEVDRAGNVSGVVEHSRGNARRGQKVQ